MHTVKAVAHTYYGSLGYLSGIMSSTKDQQPRKALPPGQRVIDRLLRWRVDHPTISGSVPQIDLKTYCLEITGCVERPLSLSWQDILSLPKVESISDFHCVDGWSVLGLRWEGVSFIHVVDLVEPKREAAFVFFECADGYTTSLSLGDLLRKNVLLAYRVDGGLLEEGTGAPLRLVVPQKYGYKSALWVTGIRFLSERKLGYWESRGYSDTADVWKNDRFST